MAKHGRPPRREGVYSATEIMEQLFYQNTCDLPKKTGRVYSTCLRRIAKILSEMNPGGEGSDWVTEDKIGCVLLDKSLNVYVLMKGRGVTRREAEELWGGRREAENRLHRWYVDWEEKESLPDVGMGVCRMECHQIDDMVLKLKIEALLDLLFRDFDEEAYRKDVKQYMALDIVASVDGSNCANAEEATGRACDTPLGEDERERMQKIMLLEKRLHDLTFYGRLWPNRKLGGVRDAED